MSYATVVAVDQFVALLLAVAVCAAAVIAGTPRTDDAVADARRDTRRLLLLAVGLVAAKAATSGLVASHGWTFAERRFTVELPLAGLPVVVAAVLAWLRPRGAAVVVATLAAAVGSVAAVADNYLVPGAVVLAALVAAVVAAPLLGWALWLGGPHSGAAGPLLQVARVGCVVVVVAALAGPVATSRLDTLPGTFDLADYGTADTGGAPGSGHSHGAGGTSVADLTGPQGGEPDVTYELTASTTSVRTTSGRHVDALAFNGTVPGPELRARQGDLVEVTLRNEDVSDGVTIHWHGYDVPNAEDGVAGVTQDAVAPGESHVYRFRAEQAGSFWYHAHQASSESVARGLYGALVVLPADPPADGLDLAVVDHASRPAGGFVDGGTYEVRDRVERRSVEAGTPVRLRLINTDNRPHRYRVLGADYVVAAIDGTDVVEPSPLDGSTRLLVAGGGRYDVTFTMPDGPVTVTGLGERVRLVLGEGAAADPRDEGDADLDPATYGSPAEVPFDADTDYDREFTIDIGRRLGFADGRFGFHWSVNGEVFPRMPMYVVAEGDVVRSTVINRTSAHHPMHLHGHHILVLERNGEPATGSPWWTDTLNVAPGERYVVAFRASNPGIWMDHCHDLEHAADGFVMHLMYEGVTTPYTLGGEAGNAPE